MKKLFVALSLAIAVLFSACNTESGVTVTVTNPLEMTVNNQTVEISWDTLTAKIADLTPETVVVTDAAGKQVTSQVIFTKEATPSLLIFQASLEKGQSANFNVAKGVREEYVPLVFGRFVPERMDDYAWENNVVAFRTYGPALGKEFSTSGLDYWAKSTPELIIDKWYEKDLSGKGSYHIDTGEGSDCYKVGATMGSGGSAPLFDGKLWYSHNFKTWETLANGPIRTTVLLTYDPYKVGEMTIDQTKTISLDANTHFNKITDVFTGSFDTLSVAAGSVIHEDAKLCTGANYDALYEPASDSRTEGGDGSIGGAVIMLNGKAMQVDGNMARVSNVKSGEPLTYYAGAATSKAGIDAAKWETITSETAAQIATPFQVAVK